MRNSPDKWIKLFPEPNAQDHKYSRGQVVVLGGVEMTGAACLSADAAARIGAGLVTIIAPRLTLWQKRNQINPTFVYRAYRPYIIVRNKLSLLQFYKKAIQKGRVVPVIGPGLGNDEYGAIRQIVRDFVKQGGAFVLDADGLNAFIGHGIKVHGHSVLTPHEGEFKKLFPDISLDNRISAAEQAAKRIDGVIVLKGAETVIAQNGRPTILNTKASPFLATAGAGDVLSGMIAGLMAQGMPSFDAACSAVWLHGYSAEQIGAGLVASDLIEIIPKTLKEILGISKKVG